MEHQHAWLVIRAARNAREQRQLSAQSAPYQQSLREIAAAAALQGLIQMEQPVQLAIQAVKNAPALLPPSAPSAPYQW